ncbi:50S ribosomal protein L11 methyltransferase [Rhodobacter veldkampii DSM 11550]|uniref:Ribosomal protein L11 methyltransferase n=1 Tax=Phaeovulum veldkampii DSM 11550 TaxID=1185920 RepID=A0A2T4JHZ5_9RHOB|nr:50S ribosomal protein L11 methyltransferase [Phaeovulum veldkampii]MBK5945587.1 50S ribosomal protein L11 methyltransferase [Phaeovulum veldkampii DSM 11550]PTE17526.1 50S ribosomal protein L11 methyltransferase [Phaeovulum veldkampii DSM 11550]TDQ60196.1 [LSU ribosomal protein L11P]-lysine N-methyltransferase [Phaeovulum veldkampii DSM 11550]
MPTYTAFTTLPDRDRAEALAELLEDLDPEPYGVGVFEIEDGSERWEVGSYFTEAPDETMLALLAAAHGAAPFAVSELPEVDWVAHVKRELAPVVAGRFFVYGSHDADKVPEGVVALLIEAAMAFGTGHHGTTLGCLTALDRLDREGFRPASVADIGCGTAVLAMAAAKIWPGTVLASDIDPVAVDTAAANVLANDLAGRVECLQAAGFDHPRLAEAAPFDLVFANILKGPLIDLAPAMTAQLAPGGRVILSGILNEQADEVVRAYENAGFTLQYRDEFAEWTTLVLKRQQS